MSGNAFLNGRLFFATRFISSSTRNVLTAMLVSLAEVALCNRDLAMRTIAEFDTGISAGKIGTNQLFSVFDIFGDDKISSLHTRQKGTHEKR